MKTYEIHKCTAEQVGEWYIFRCPLCAGYERKMNVYTGEMKVMGKVKYVRHQGSIIEGKTDMSALADNSNLNSN